MKLKETKLWLGSAITDAMNNKAQQFSTVFLRKHSCSLWERMKMATQGLDRAGNWGNTKLLIWKFI